MSKRRSKLKGQVKKIAKSIAKLYEAEVIKQDLIDTGLMRDSFRVSIDIDKHGNMDILVSSVYYFKYIDVNQGFDVSGEVFKSKKYLALESRLIDLIYLEFALELPSGFATSDSVRYNFLFSKFFKGGQFIPGGNRAPKGGIRA